MLWYFETCDLALSTLPRESDKVFASAAYLSHNTVERPPPRVSRRQTPRQCLPLGDPVFSRSPCERPPVMEYSMRIEQRGRVQVTRLAQNMSSKLPLFWKVCPIPAYNPETRAYPITAPHTPLTPTDAFQVFCLLLRSNHDAQHSFTTSPAYLNGLLCGLC